MGSSSKQRENTKLGGQGGGGMWGELEGEANMVNIYCMEFIKLKKIPKRFCYTHPENTPEK